MRQHLPLDTIATRRRIWFAFGGFPIGFLSVLGSGVWMIVRLAPESHDARWLVTIESVMMLAQFLFFAFIGGGLLCIAGMVACDRWHYARGYYRCHQCNRRLSSWRVPCVCWGRDGSVARRPRASRWRHYRKHGWRIASILLILLPVVYVVSRVAPARATQPLTLLDMVIGHGMFSLVVVLLMELLCMALESLHKARRFRLRMQFVLRTLALWPLIAAVAMMFAKQRG